LPGTRFPFLVSRLPFSVFRRPTAEWLILGTTVYCLAREPPAAEQFQEQYRMQYESVNLESIRRDIAKRLRPTCADMPQDDFDKMVARMALIEWKHLNDATPTSQMQSH
jgi:hypothetical protein